MEYDAVFRKQRHFTISKCIFNVKLSVKWCPVQINHNLLTIEMIRNSADFYWKRPSQLQFFVECTGLFFLPHKNQRSFNQWQKKSLSNAVVIHYKDFVDCLASVCLGLFVLTSVCCKSFQCVSWWPGKQGVMTHLSSRPVFLHDQTSGCVIPSWWYFLFPLNIRPFSCSFALHLPPLTMSLLFLLLAFPFVFSLSSPSSSLLLHKYPSLNPPLLILPLLLLLQSDLPMSPSSSSFPLSFSSSSSPCVPSGQANLIRSVVPVRRLKHHSCLLQLAWPLRNTPQHRGAPRSALFIKCGRVVGEGEGEGSGNLLSCPLSFLYSFLFFTTSQQFLPLTSTTSPPLSISLFPSIMEGTISVHERLSSIFFFLRKQKVLPFVLNH